MGTSLVAQTAVLMVRKKAARRVFQMAVQMVGHWALMKAVQMVVELVADSAVLWVALLVDHWAEK